MISRRAWIGGMAGWAAAPPGSRRLAYVASYSSPDGPEGSRGNGDGIYLFEQNPATGALKRQAVFANPLNPSWLALDPGREHLYSANETKDGSVSAYVIERGTGRLTLLNRVSSQGAGPAHVSVHPAGKFVFAANYAGGTIAVLPVTAGGGLGEACDVLHDEGAVGPTKASGAPPGSFAISGHDRVHAHMVQADPRGDYVLAADLGLDRIFVWKFDAGRGRLTPNQPPWMALPPGDGPRHFVFHPSGRWLYSLQEEASTLAMFDYDAGRGALRERQTVSTLPRGFAGTNFTSEVAIAPGGRFLYAANRLHDSIAWFAIGEHGTLRWSGEEWTRGDYPRSFTIDPAGDFLYACNQRSDAIAALPIHHARGPLNSIAQHTPVGTPAGG